ncbi:MAG: hypothetical protein ACPG4U_00880 [Pseudomonadales bacterium]
MKDSIARHHSLLRLPLYALCSSLLYFPVCQASERELQIHLRGTISERCEIEALPYHGAHMDFSTRIENSAALKIDCNLPMALHVRSERGALVSDSIKGGDKRQINHHRPPSQQRHYRTYAAHIEIEKLGFRMRANSRDLYRGMRFNTGPTIPFDTQGLLTVRLDAPLLYAGTYKDVLHIEVSPSQGTGGL